MNLNPLDLLFLIAGLNLLAMLLVGNWRGAGILATVSYGAQLLALFLIAAPTTASFGFSGFGFTLGWHFDALACCSPSSPWPLPWSRAGTAPANGCAASRAAAACC
jgi:hypothetical protein